MKLIQSDALVLVNRLLGLAGGLMQEPTNLDESTLSQVIDIGAILRRARCGGALTGWFHGVMQNVHAVADDQDSSVLPYDAGAAIPGQSAYPSPVPRHLDLHLIAATVERTAGAGALTGGGLLMTSPQVDQAFGVNQAGALVETDLPVPLVRWTALETGAAALAIGISGDGSVYHRINLRLPRDVTLHFFTTAAAAATFRCGLVLGLFPEGLGQDVGT